MNAAWLAHIDEADVVVSLSLGERIPRKSSRCEPLNPARGQLSRKPAECGFLFPGERAVVRGNRACKWFQEVVHGPDSHSTAGNFVWP